ncbi:hypothetical protein M1843_00955 [Isoptericola sp. 4D.3]|uniref:Uncharacterized protein n=1 Tax=Isoptericola peretonis TaxID=2918523 RepID=A0ABT0IYJ7_9MICO|nr:hypothetical protein [Isoptericola sp. 4D.3]
MSPTEDAASPTLASLVDENGDGWIYDADPSWIGGEHLDVVSDHVQLSRDADAEPAEAFTVSATLAVAFEHLVPLDVDADDEWEWLNSRWDRICDFFDDLFEAPTVQLHDEVIHVTFFSVAVPADATLADALTELRRWTDVEAFVSLLTTDPEGTDRFPNELAHRLERSVGHSEGSRS